MQRNQQSTQGRSEQVFTASEIGEYEYCPLAWWYARYEPHVEIDTEELFAELVEMEQAYGPQAPALPEYQFIEQLLVQRGAFEEGQQQESEHDKQIAVLTDLEELAEERQGETGIAGQIVQLRVIIVTLIVLAIVFLVMAVVLRSW